MLGRGTWVPPLPPERGAKGGHASTFSEANSHTDGEEERQVAEDGIAGDRHYVPDDRQGRPVRDLQVAAKEHADAEQKRRCGEHRDREHQRLPDLL
jgi:hypothetical protein